MTQKKVDVIVDLQFGSTGKGLIAGYLAEQNGYETVVNANMPNAGHTYVNSKGRKWVHKVLPNGIVSPYLRRVLIGPGSIFDLDQLNSEIDGSADLLNSSEHEIMICIHENAMVLDPTHVAHERATLTGISSTMQGSSAAMCEKIGRSNRANIAKRMPFPNHPVWQRVVVVNSEEWNYIIKHSASILLEGAQGYSLGINAGFYPYCTSRDCSPARFLSDCQIPFQMVRHVIGTARIHPIRVGSLPGSTSGDVYPYQEEITWQSIGQEPEKTTVTGRNRRIFTFSERQIHEAIMVCRPDFVFLNFCNYDPDKADYYRNRIDGYLKTYCGEEACVMWTGWGPSFNDVMV